MSTASITQHPLYTSLALQGRHVVARLRRVPAQRWRTLCLAIVLLWAVDNLSQAFWLLLPSPGLEQPPLAPPPEISDTATQAGTIDLAAIQEAALFGEGGIVVVEQPAQTAVLPGIEQSAVDTTLNLRLQGIIASSDPEAAWAIIADGNNQALYRVGDKLPQGNASLVKVLEQRIILDNSGRYESLWLYSKEDAERRASFNQDSGGEPATQGQNRYQSSSSNYGNERVVNRNEQPQEPAGDSEVHTLPASVAEEVKSISDVVRFTAARGNTGMMGYRIQPGRNRQLFDQAGLQPGDVVTAVNGISLDDPQQIRAVYQELQTATRAQLSILRDGEPVSIEISLDSAR